MIAVICAMREERDAMLKLLKNVKTVKGKQIFYHGDALDNEYYIGDMGKKEVILCRCGVGILYASITTVLLIEEFNPEFIINIGVAGSVSENVHVGDVVIAERAVNWRIDVPGWERSKDSLTCSFACDQKIVDMMKKKNKDEEVHFGTIVTGDEFIYKKSQLKEIRKYFPDALCGEMEGYAIAGTAYAFSIPVCIIRSISDEALVSGNYKEFYFNLEEECDQAASICREMIRGIR